MKKPNHVFATVKKDQRWGRVIDFKTRQVVGEITPKQSANMRILESHKPTKMNEGGFVKRILNQNSYQNLFLTLTMLLLTAIVLYSQTANANDRSPQGEFSSLVETEKTREDFKSDEEMQEYIKEQDENLNMNEKDKE